MNILKNMSVVGLFGMLAAGSVARCKRISYSTRCCRWFPR